VKLTLSGFLTTISAIVLLVIGGSVVTSPTAQAATPVGGHGPGQYVSWPKYTNMWAGVYEVPGGWAFCVDPMTSAPTGTSSSDPHQLTTWKTGAGTTLSAQDLAVAAYITYQLPTNPTTLQAATAKLALMAILQPVSWGNFDPFVAGSDGQVAANAIGILSQVQSLVAQARAKAVTWDGTSPPLTTNMDTLSVPGSVITASASLPGVPAGYTVTFTVTLPDKSTKTIESTTTPDGTAVMSYTTNLPGTYSVTYAISNLPPRYPQAIDPASPDLQRMFLSIPSPRSAASPAPATVLLKYNPGVSTQASAPTVTAGDTLTDRVQSTGLETSLTWTLTGNLYGPQPAIDGSCDGVDWSAAPAMIPEFSHTIVAAEVDATGTALTSGLGAWPVPLTLVDTCVSYGERLVGRNSTGTVLAEADHPVGSPAQTVLVRSGTPVISSTVSLTTAKPGQQIAESGVIDNATFGVGNVTYTWTWHGSLGRVSGDCDTADWTQAETAATFEYEATDANLTGTTVTLPDVAQFTIPLNQPPMCYSYAASVTVQGSDGWSLVIDLPFGDPAETTAVSGGVPVVTSAVSQTTPAAGETVTDTGHITNLVMTDDSGATYTTTWHGTVRGPVDPGGSWDSAPVVLEFDRVVTADDVDTDGTATLPELGAFTIPSDDHPRCYSWEAEITIAGSDGSSFKTIHPAGDPTQTACAPAVPVPIIMETGGTASSPGSTQIGFAGMLSVVIGAAFMLGRFRRPG